MIVLPEMFRGLSSEAAGFGDSVDLAMATGSGGRVCSTSTSTLVADLSPDDEPHLADSTSTLAPQPTVAVVMLTNSTKGSKSA